MRPRLLSLIRRLMRGEIAALEDVEADVAVAFPEIPTTPGAAVNKAAGNPHLSIAVKSWILERATRGFLGSAVG